MVVVRIRNNLSKVLWQNVFRKSLVSLMVLLLILLFNIKMSLYFRTLQETESWRQFAVPLFSGTLNDQSLLHSWNHFPTWPLHKCNSFMFFCTPIFSVVIVRITLTWIRNIFLVLDRYIDRRKAENILGVPNREWFCKTQSSYPAVVQWYVLENASLLFIVHVCSALLEAIRHLSK